MLGIPVLDMADTPVADMEQPDSAMKAYIYVGQDQDKDAWLGSCAKLCS